MGGGEIPIYAGHGDNTEWVDDKWVNTSEYKRYKFGEGIMSLLLGIGGSYAFFYVVKNLKTKKTDILTDN